MTPIDPNALIIHIDGSAITNPGETVGCAGIVSYPDSDEKVELQWNYDYGTSGSMELAALVNAIKWINANVADLKSSGITRVVILSDNATVVGGVGWIHTWYKNKWRKGDGSPVRNIPLWNDYRRERLKTTITIEVAWKKGKSDTITKRVDKLAKTIAKTPAFPKTRPTHKPSVGRSLTGKELMLTDYDETSARHVARVFYHSYIPRSKDCEVRFETINNKTGKVTGKYRAFASRAIDTQIDRGHLYMAEIDTAQGHPRILKVEAFDGDEEARLRLLFIKNGYLKK